MDHVAVKHVRLPAADARAEPENAAGMGGSAPQLETLGWNARPLCLLAHGPERRQGHDAYVVPPSTHCFRQNENLLICTPHAHAGREQEQPHTSRSCEPTIPRRTTRLRPVGMYA